VAGLVRQPLPRPVAPLQHLERRPVPRQHELPERRHRPVRTTDRPRRRRPEDGITGRDEPLIQGRGPTNRYTREENGHLGSDRRGGTDG
jgi:hypothetical protein